MLNIKKDILDKINEFIKDVPLDEKINGMKVKKFVLNNLDVKEEFDKLLVIYPQLQNYGNIITLIRNNLDPDIVLFCKVCHKPLKIKYGLAARKMARYCSVKCSSNDNITIKKRKQTNIEKYGVVAPIQSKQILEKIKRTNQLKYHVDFPWQNKEIQAKAHKNINYDKRNKTTIKTLNNLYGENITNISQLDEVKEKKKQTLINNNGNLKKAYKKIFKKVSKTVLEKYGVDNIQKLKQFHQSTLDKSWNKNVLAWSEYIIPLFDKSEWERI